ncbi:Nitroreductase [Amycolatopsis xylanica]|uniref:Nitroreductase n=1 Tax=Amycolatopsis xylanica TaxID=589385 RepID=A0A1H2ZD02_9PSEU|nr:nitroreductase family protein [Amycolatopsis xylanica]SDX15372.1 Nitroreductase [Amycolatopsis xylanica]
MEKPAETSVPVTEEIARRWSPRAFDETADVSDEQLRAMLEAARWAPSSGNTQPARYLVGRRGDETFKNIYGSLADGNKIWAHRAGVLLIGLVVTHNEKGEIPHADYGLGLASQNLVLQAVREGLVAHQMGGFDPYAVIRDFELPDGLMPRVAIAAGKQAAPEILEAERLIEREIAPRVRIPLSDFAFSSPGNPIF